MSLVHPFRSIDFSNLYILPKLTDIAYQLWTISGGDRSTARSYWIGREDHPIHLLEVFAQVCAHFHCGDNFLGVEYWTQFRVAEYAQEDGDNAGLGFHFGNPIDFAL
jgi:hypothetical protein